MLDVSTIRVATYTAFKRFDPTHTTALRNAFARKMNGKFNELTAVIRKAIVDQNCFGLREGNMLTLQLTPPSGRAFDFPLSKDKVEAFMRWLEDQIDKGMLTVGTMEQLGLSIDESWMNMYILDSYKRGVIRARYELQKAGFDVPSIEDTGGIIMSMSTPFHMDRLGLLYLRAYEELKGITAQMSTQIARVLAQGIADGDGPRLLARKMRAVIDGTDAGELGITDTLGRYIPAKRRAEMLARTEMIRAHHTATVQEYRNWAAYNVIVQAEWMTAGDNRVCDRCARMQGNIYTLDEIEKLIPLHPQCRCIALPYVEGMPKIPTEIMPKGRLAGTAK